METLSFFKALADETRLRLLTLLARHELNVNEIVAVMDMGQSRISWHLKILTDSGLLVSRRDGLWAFYRAADSGRGKELVDIFRRITAEDDILQKDLQHLEEILSQGHQEKKRFFDSLAPEWDNIKEEIIGGLKVEDEIVPLMKKCAVAADLGCGTGMLLPVLRKVARRVIGVDRSSRMLEQARQNLERYGDGIELRIGEIEHLPMRDNEADAAVINMVLHYITAPFNGIKEAARILKKGASLVIVDLKKHSNEDMRTKFGHRWLGFSQEEMGGWLRRSGFDIKQIKEYHIEMGLIMNIILSIRE